MTSKLKVLGLDLSITATGIAHPNGATETIKTRPGDGDRRLLQIRGYLRKAVDAGVDLAVIEDLPTHAHGAGITGMVHGAVRAVLMGASVPYVLVTPATLKSYATGKGNADKPDMAVAAFEKAGREFPGDLTPAGKGGDQCDAWWLRHAGLDHYGFAEFELPQAQRSRLDKVDWPDMNWLANIDKEI